MVERSAATVDPGPVPELAWLPVDELAADPAYQRTIESRRSQQSIRRMVERFSWSLFQAATVARMGWGDAADRPEIYSVIDGQHRIEAARRLGFESVPCLVVDTDSLAEAARLFVEANRNRVNLTPLALHKALVAAGDDLACAVHRAVAAAGVEILPYPVQAADMKAGQTMAVGSIRLAVKDHGEEAATAALRIVLSLWLAAGELRAERIRAAAATVGRFGVARATGWLDSIDSAPFDRAAEGAALAGKPRWAAIAEAMAAKIEGREIYIAAPPKEAEPQPAPARTRETVDYSAHGPAVAEPDFALSAPGGVFPEGARFLDHPHAGTNRDAGARGGRCVGPWRIRHVLNAEGPAAKRMPRWNR